ncbi:hypothetical protein D3C76_1581410 [compost metagenome]
MRAHQFQLLLQPHAAEDLHHVRADMDARPQAGKLRRLLEHLDIEPGLLQQRGGGRPTQTRTDDCDFLPTTHGYLSSCSDMWPAVQPPDDLERIRCK